MTAGRTTVHAGYPCTDPASSRPLHPGSIQAAADQQSEILREATIVSDRIASTVNATGAIEPETLVTLTFGLDHALDSPRI